MLQNKHVRKQKFHNTNVKITFAAFQRAQSSEREEESALNSLVWDVIECNRRCTVPVPLRDCFCRLQEALIAFMTNDD